MKQKIWIIASVFLLTFGITSNAVSQWVQTSGNLINGISCFANTNSNLFVAGFATTIGLSTDHGKSWTIQSSSAPGTFTFSLAAIGTNVIEASTDSRAFRSTDNGVNWISINKLIGSIQSLSAIGQSFFVATDSGVFISTDYGANWSSANNGLKQSQSYNLFADGSTLFVRSDNGLFRTTNNGITWSLMTNFPGGQLAASNAGLFAINDTAVFLSSDEGSHWVLKGAQKQAFGEPIFASGTDLFMGVGVYNGMVFESSDYGVTWDTIGNMHRVNTLIVSGPNLVVGSTNTGIWYAPISDFTNAVKNPFQPDLNISLSPNPTTGIITVHNAPANILHVTVSSILGESVLELEHPNAPEFTLDLSKLPQGIYVAKFEMEGGVITKKIVKE